MIYHKSLPIKQFSSIFPTTVLFGSPLGIPWYTPYLKSARVLLGVHWRVAPIGSKLCVVPEGPGGPAWGGFIQQGLDQIRNIGSKNPVEGAAPVKWLLVYKAMN
jgi:hypothetical protein